MPSSIVTNGKIRTGAPSQAYKDNWDRIFGKKQTIQEQRDQEFLTQFDHLKERKDASKTEQNESTDKAVRGEEGQGSVLRDGEQSKA